MPKSAKKTAPKVVEVAAPAPATTPKSLKKGKRQPEEATEKKLSNKKQKNEVGAQEVIVKEVGEKNQKKKKVAPNTQKKKAVKKQESSDPSSESEEELELGDSEKIEESGSEDDEDINDSDENLNEKKEESGEDAESDDDDDDVESDDDDDDDVESDVDEVSDTEMVDVATKPNAKKSSVKKETKTSSVPSQASGSKTLFIGNLNFSVEKADVENLFEGYGDLVDVRIGVRADGSSRGFGHVEFATVEAAQKALEEKNGQDLQGRPVRLDIAAEKGAYTPQSNSKDAKSSQQKGSGVKTIYVRGFDKSSEENDIKKVLREHFSDCGEVTRISVPSDDDGGCKGFAYIDFTNNDSMTKAQELDQSTLDGYTLTVEEAKPRDGAGGGRFSGGRGGGRRGGGRFGGRDGGGRGRGGGGRRGGGRGGGGRGRGRW